MSDITFTRTGKTFYQVDSAVAAMFVEAGLAERYVAPPKPVVAPQWRLYANSFGEIKGIAIEIGAETIIVAGSPSQIAGKAQRALAGRKAPLPTEALIAAYARQADPAVFTPVPTMQGLKP